MDAQIAENPLREGLPLEKLADPCLLVIFGASGDLTKRKLMPSLYSLFQQNLLPSGFAVVGSARTDLDHQEFRREMMSAVQEFSGEEELDQDTWENFAETLFYQPTNFDEPESYNQLQQLLQDLDRDRNTSENRLFYLATPPGAYEGIIERLEDLKGNSSESWSRVIVEKPFGRDLGSARSLNAKALKVFREEEVYRIDHYLGKETVQNIMVLRFGNSIFEPLWDRRYIEHVQITSAEDIGVGDRGGYYEEAGALRDMIQNHLFQLLSLVAMEPPVSMDAQSVRDEKNRVMRAVRPFGKKDVSRLAVRGQYDEGFQDGEAVASYRDEEGVSTDSNTETFAALKLQVDNWRWADVPFYLRSGKRLVKKTSEIAIQFHRLPHLIFDQKGDRPLDVNSLIIRIQPEEGISLRFQAKVPGQTFRLRPVHMEFQYGPSFGKRSPDAYERLLLDAMLGDPTLFARGDMVERAWELLMPVLEVWESDPEIPLYESGSWGPEEANQLIEGDGWQWRRP